MSFLNASEHKVQKQIVKVLYLHQVLRSLMFYLKIKHFKGFKRYFT